MRIAIATAVLAVGCGFHAHSTTGHDDGGTTTDADPNALDARADAPPGSVCIGHFAIVCRNDSLADLTFDTAETIDTDHDTRCVYEGQGPGAPKLCVIARHDIHVNAAINATGTHPLVLAAFNNLEIPPPGSLDVGSHLLGVRGPGAGDPSCHPSTKGGDGLYGGGGAGGSLGGTGGGGGTGDVGGTAQPGQPGGTVASLIRVTGGCDGGYGGTGSVVATGGAGGAGGGAVMLLAGAKLTVAGIVTAGGAGAGGAFVSGGGGGGGSGGFIGLEGATYMLNGFVTANGGGGSTGGGASLAGSAGGDGLPSGTIAAPGGAPGSGGGHGGNGSVATVQTGVPGESSQLLGGGGGGGGAGVIILVGVTPTGGTFSPSPSAI